MAEFVHGVGIGTKTGGSRSRVRWDCAKFISKSDPSSKPMLGLGVGIGSRSGIGGLGWGWDHGRSLSHEVVTGVGFDVWNPHYIN
ncbi:hypothetical protein TIFTF001_031406 [Ficus carica]|uniref:Uncharacterized protein n=1 Tax=Ficus carica TaxID=3494 RepID=A0AA88J5F7_FICCA|nr:hypothetical protein TIFTF001_031406 [Ficus carica]